MRQAASDLARLDKETKQARRITDPRAGEGELLMWLCFDWRGSAILLQWNTLTCDASTTISLSSEKRHVKLPAECAHIGENMHRDKRVKREKRCERLGETCQSPLDATAHCTLP